MKSTPRVSAPVLAFGLIALILSAVVGWYGYQRHQARGGAAADAAATDPDPDLASAPDSDGEIMPAEPEVVAMTFPDGFPPVIPISLVPHLIEAENGTWLKDNQYKLLPRGTQDFGGIEFHLEGMIQLQGRQSKDWKKYSYRQQVSLPLALTNQTDGRWEIMQRGSKIASVYVLAGTRYESDSEAVAANLVWRYTDGTSATTPIQFNVHVRDWIREEFEQPERLPYPFTKVVWTTPVAKQPERALRLYRLGLANPAPQKVIQRLDFLGMTGDATLFVTALTLDPVPLGQRPDGTPDLEPTDAIPGSLLQLQVIGPDDQPIAKAKIRLQIRRKAGTVNPYVTRSLGTDSQGTLGIKYSSDNLQSFEVGAAHEDFGGRKMLWDLSAGDWLPAAYTLKLGHGISLGGTVVDEGDQPIAEAKLSFNRFWSSEDDSPNQAGNRPDFQSKNVITDAVGQWQLRGVPKELLDNISFNITHADFTATNFNLRGKSDDEAKLRAGTHKIVLKRGLIVTGRVLDESDNPVKEARVWVGRPYYSGTQETKTDATGAFRFQGVPEGSQSFSVLAKDLKPVVTNLTVKTGLAEIIFRLGPGLTLRGIVKNETGEPVSGVRISLENERGGVSQDYNFEMTTDSAGRFEWNGAPETELKFSFLKQGYESKRQQPLKTTAENVITLRKGRTVQAWVVDAETEQPITKFRAGAGRNHGFGDSDQFYAEYPGMKNYTDANGLFTLELNEEQVNAIKAEADDYAGKVEKLPAAENGVVQVTLRLKPSASVRGVLVNAAGQPVPGASVALTKDGSMGGTQVQFRKGRLTGSGRDTTIVTTDAEGKFTLGSPPETGGLVIAAADAGFARSTVDEVRHTGRLVLQEYGRIEGSIKIAGAPSAGQEFMFSLMNIGVNLDWESYRTTSDADGKFSFEKIPPGEGELVRLIKTSPSSWMHSHKTTVTVAPGQTAPVSFGAEGAVINGQVRLEIPPGEGEEFNFSGSLNSKMPAFNQKFATPAEATAFYQSAEWREQSKQRKYYGVAINPDGSFSVDSIPPGEYTLSVSATKPKPGGESWNRATVASGSTTVTVPDSASPYTPIGLNILVLKPVPNR
jgi:hypothetical protein